MKLTKATIERISIPAGKKDVIVFDDALPGFGLRVREGGSRNWVVQYKVGLTTRRVTLGSVAALDPDEARRRARSELSKVHLGADPAAERAEAKAQAALTLGRVVDDYLERRAREKLRESTFADVRRYLKVHWAPLGALPVRKVTRADVAAGLARIARNNGDYAANRARAALGALYKWAIGEGFVDTNPVVGTNKPADEVARDRVLSDAELARVLRDAGEGDYGKIIRLLTLTGARREEVGAMRWPEVDLAAATWRLPPERSKNGRPHDVPLSVGAIAILAAQPRRDDSDYVFGAGRGAWSGWSKAKAALDARIGAAGPAPPAWRVHDIRRSVATGMANLGVAPHVIEAVLNHQSGSKSGVSGVYNRSSYATEKRAALDLWAAHIAEIVQTLCKSHDPGEHF